jgi:hypothetical protein
MMFKNIGPGKVGIATGQGFSPNGYQLQPGEVRAVEVRNNVVITSLNQKPAEVVFDLK